MTGRPRGGPGDYEARLMRAEELLDVTPSATESLAILADVLRHQQHRAATPQVSATVERIVADEPRRRLHRDFPLLELSRSIGPIASEIEWAIAALDRDVLPATLRRSADELRNLASEERPSIVAAWIEESDLVSPALAFWCRAAAGPVFELPAAAISPLPEGWLGRRCPVCDGSPQVSVVGEPSAEFTGGAPRTLVCARCASWWAFPRATCPQCGRQDPRRESGFVEPADRAVRIDGCEACHGYIKTFDLREPETDAVVPLVDDVATLSLDVWAQEHGFHRVHRSFAGV